MRKLWSNLSLYLLSLFCCFGLYAQNTTTLTGTVIDPDSQAWLSGSWSATIVVPGGGVAHYLDGSLVQPSYFGALDNIGAFQTGAVVGNTSKMVPFGATWRFTVCPVASTPCQTLNPTQVIGTTVNIATTFINPHITNIRINGSIGGTTPITLNWAYAANEVINQINGSGYISTSAANECFVWNTNTWVPFCSGGGGGTPSPPHFSIQFNDPLGTFAGSSQFITDSQGNVEIEGGTNGSGTLEVNSAFNGGDGWLLDESDLTLRSTGANTALGGIALNDSDANYTGLSTGLIPYFANSSVHRAGKNAINFDSELTGASAGSLTGYEADSPNGTASIYRAFFSSDAGNGSIAPTQTAYTAQTILNTLVGTGYADFVGVDNSSNIREKIGVGPDFHNNFEGHSSFGLGATVDPSYSGFPIHNLSGASTITNLEETSTTAVGVNGIRTVVTEAPASTVSGGNSTYASIAGITADYDGQTTTNTLTLGTTSTARFTGNTITTNLLEGGAFYADVSGDAGVTGGVVGMTGESDVNSNGHIASIVGNGAIVNVQSGSANIDFGYGTNSTFDHSGTGTITNAFGVSTYVANDSTGTIMNAHGVEAVTYFNATTIPFSASFYGYTPIEQTGGGITNQYGVYLEPQSIAGVANSWGIFSAGTTDNNDFAGNMRVGFGGTLSNVCTQAVPCGSVLKGSGTYSTSISDTFTIVGLSATSKCTFAPTNATASLLGTSVPFITGYGTNTVTIQHPGINNGGTIDLVCAP